MSPDKATPGAGTPGDRNTGTEAVQDAGPIVIESPATHGRQPLRDEQPPLPLLGDPVWSAFDMSDTELSSDEWHALALDAIDTLAASGDQFTAEDVRRSGVPEAPTPNCWGAAFLVAQHNGVIVAVGARRSFRPSRHRSLHRVWIGRWAA